MFEEHEHELNFEDEGPGSGAGSSSDEAGEKDKKKGSPGKKGGGKVTIPEEEYEELKEKSLKADEYYDSYLRGIAELDNFRKRAARERESIGSFAVEEVVIDFLGVLDNLERALSAADSTEDFDSLHRGVEITLKDAMKVLEKWGVSEVPALGEEFDPEKHEAFMTVESSSSDEDEKVVEVLRKGYRLKDKLIRPSLVKVAGRS